jgi:hypothetical protein
MRFSGTLADAAQFAERRQVVRFYDQHPRPNVDLEEQLQEIQQARRLTDDEGVLEYSSLMVQALVSQ